MSKVCDICGKRKTAGNTVTFSHKGIKRSFTPNLRRVKVYDEKGTPSRKSVCTRCLRSGKVNRNKANYDYQDQTTGAVEENEVAVEATVSEEVVEENSETAEA